MKKIVICSKGSYKLPRPVMEYLYNNGHHDITETSFKDDRENPALIAALEAAQIVRTDIAETASALDCAIDKISAENDDIITQWDDIEYTLFSYMREICAGRVRRSDECVPNDDIRKKHLLTFHILKHSDWSTCLAAIQKEFPHPYNDDIVEEMEYIYNKICEHVDYSQGVLHAWDTKYIANAFMEYISGRHVAWDKFAQLLYQFTVYCSTDFSYTHLRNMYKKYEEFIAAHGDIICKYNTLLNDYHQFMTDNSLNCESRNGTSQYVFKSPLIIEEYDETKYTATVVQLENPNSAFERKRKCCRECMRLTPYLNRTTIENFVKNGDTNGMWDYLTSFAFVGVEYRD